MFMTCACVCVCVYLQRKSFECCSYTRVTVAQEVWDPREWNSCSGRVCARTEVLWFNWRRLGNGQLQIRIISVFRVEGLCGFDYGLEQFWGTYKSWLVYTECILKQVNNHCWIEYILAAKFVRGN